MSATDNFNFSYGYQLDFWKNKGFSDTYAKKFAYYMSEVYGLTDKTAIQTERIDSAMQQFSYALDNDVFPRFKNRVEMAIAILRTHSISLEKRCII